MVETDSPELAGKELRYGDATWTLSGTMDVREDGQLVEVEARRADDVRHEEALFRFHLNDPPDSLNPGNLGDRFDRIERTSGRVYLVLKDPGRTYRYRLRSMEYR